MHKVIVERPRGGAAPRKGGRAAARERLDLETSPRQEGMTRWGRTKWPSEHLGPLRRFLMSRVGRRWDAVHSEICQRIRPDNVVQRHILQHLPDLVALEVELEGGVPCHGGSDWRRGPLVPSGWCRVYVCPRSGLLKQIPPAKRAPELQAVPRRQVDDRLYYKVGGAWFRVELAPIPELPGAERGCYDVVFERRVSMIGTYGTRERLLVEIHGAPGLYACRRYPLTRRERRLVGEVGRVK
ncbi:MAG: hypothetical protein R3B09_25475 [Nannocystaceae bacterium]